MAITAAIAGVVVAAAAGGASYHQSSEASRQAKDATRDQENAAIAERSKLAANEDVAKQTSAMRMARARQLSLAGQQNGIASTYAAPSSALGGSGAPGAVGGKQKLGE